MTSAPRRARGFTLLELVISCTILVTVFAFAATALTRVHRLRVESEAQTRLMTEGRALLDDLATQLAYVAGTNLWLETAPSANEGGDDGGATLALVRYAVPPHAASPGEAFRSTLQITASNRTGLLADVTIQLSNMHIFIQKNKKSNKTKSEKS